MFLFYSSNRKLRADPENRKFGFENVNSSLKSALIRTGEKGKGETEKKKLFKEKLASEKG